MTGMKYSLIPKKNRKAIFEYLFKEGVIVVQKDAKISKHPEVDVPNLHAMMVLRTLKSLGYVEEKYNWQHRYYFLNNEGIEYLRSALHLPPRVFPATLTRKMASKPPGGGAGGPPGAGGRGGMGEGKDGMGGGADSGDWRPRGGFGRGRGGGGGFGDRSERPRYE